MPFVEGNRRMTSFENYEGETLIQASNLKKWFPLRTGFSLEGVRGKTGSARAVNGVNLDIGDKEIYGLVGESGCGKTTLGKLLTRLLEPTDGNITFLGTDITHKSRREMKKIRRYMQTIFQDPFSSLPVRLKIKHILLEPLKLHNIGSTQAERLKMVNDILEATDLIPTAAFIDKHPNELSGGQRQRVAIARAMMLRPRFVVADEPVSMLDVSIRAGILSMIEKLKKEYDLSVLLITHDLSVAQHMCNRIGIMYIGRIVEEGVGKDVLRNPYHPYTLVLKSVLPTLDPRTRHHLQDIPIIEEEIAECTHPPPGCCFHPRCIYAKEICKEEAPPLREFRDRMVACYAVGEWLFPQAS